MEPWRFDAPAGLRDFRNPRNWHQQMAKSAEEIVILLIAAALKKTPDKVTNEDIQLIAPQLAYAHPEWIAPPAGAETVAIQPWLGFPRAVEHASWQKDYPPQKGDERGTLRAAEHVGTEDVRNRVMVDRHDRVLHLPVRDRQDEYLEWVGERDEQGNLTKITFVAEGYDYFESLFRTDEGRVLEIYKDFTGLSNLKVDDLRAPDGVYIRYDDGSRSEVVEPGAFNPRNSFNINPGIVHLSHRANSLGAEINLAGVSALARLNAKGELLTDPGEQQLLCCNEGGNPNRNSDPLISKAAYNLVMAKHHYTLANPVGLYIAGVDDQSLLLPDGTPVPQEWWKVVRGHDLWDSANSRVLRLELSVPENEKLKLSDLTAGGSPLKYPGQVAKLMSVHLFVTHWPRADNSFGPQVGCTGTCCEKDGSDILKYQVDGKCDDGYHLKFPDLIADRKAPSPVVASEAASLIQPASMTIAMRDLPEALRSNRVPSVSAVTQIRKVR